MEIIERRRTVHNTERRHEYHYVDSPGAGFSFDVDENDDIIVTDANQHNANFCLAGDPSIVDDGIEQYEYSCTAPAVGRCHCGREVVLEGFTNTCVCGADYNSSGQRLAPRSQWGEETGETLGEILRIR